MNQMNLFPATVGGAAASPVPTGIEIPDSPGARRALASQIINLSPELPDTVRYRNYLEGLRVAKLSARLRIMSSQAGLSFSGMTISFGRWRVGVPPQISLTGRGMESALARAAVPQMAARRQIPDTSVGRPTLNIEHPALATFPAVIPSDA
jgi:hypothetical protein